MAPRASWKGYLKLSLVSCPVQLFPATTTKEKVSFHLMNRETGNRLKRRLVDPETEEPVDPDDQVRGYAVGKNEYILLEEEEIDAVAIESTHTIDIETFVPRAEIDETFLDQPYYLAPDGPMGEEAFAVIREAMRQKKVVGIGRVVLYRRERPVMLEPRGRGLVATTLRYAYEVRDDADYFDDIGEPPVPDEMLDLAQHIIGRKLAHFDADRFEDRYQDALLALIGAKQAGRAPTVSAPAQRPTNVVSLMDALRRSIASDKGAAEGAGKGAAASAARCASKGAAKGVAQEPAPAANSRDEAEPSTTVRKRAGTAKRETHPAAGPHAAAPPRRRAASRAKGGGGSEAEPHPEGAVRRKASPARAEVATPLREVAAAKGTGNKGKGTKDAAAEGVAAKGSAAKGSAAKARSEARQAAEPVPRRTRAAA